MPAWDGIAARVGRRPEALREPGGDATPTHRPRRAVAREWPQRSVRGPERLSGGRFVDVLQITDVAELAGIGRPRSGLIMKGRRARALVPEPAAAEGPFDHRAVGGRDEGRPGAAGGRGAWGLPVINVDDVGPAPAGLGAPATGPIRVEAEGPS